MYKIFLLYECLQISLGSSYCNAIGLEMYTNNLHLSFRTCIGWTFIWLGNVKKKKKNQRKPEKRRKYIICQIFNSNHEFKNVEGKQVLIS